MLGGGGVANWLGVLSSRCRLHPALARHRNRVLRASIRASVAVSSIDAAAHTATTSAADAATFFASTAAIASAGATIDATAHLTPAA